MIRFFRQFGQAFKALFRNGMMSFLAISSMTITLLFLGFFSIFLINAERLTTGVESNIKIKAVLMVDSTDNQEELTGADGKTVKNSEYHKIYDQIMAINAVESVEFSSKEDELQELVETLGEEFQMSAHENPLSDAYTISINSPDQIVVISEKIGQIEGVDEVTYGGVSTENLFSFISKLRLWGIGIAVVVLLVSLFLVSNTIRTTIFSRSTEIHIMRMVGATKGYIRVPFFLEGALVGLFGAILPVLFIFFSYPIIYKELNSDLLASGLSLYPPLPFVYYIIGGLTILAVLIGALASTISIRRYLKA